MPPIDTRTYVSTLRELVKEGNDVSLLISGSSMAPFLIHHRDTILFGPIQRALHRGDMVFYQRPNGQFVMHRIRYMRAEGMYLIGDNQTETEGPLPPECAFAIVKQVCRKGKWIGPSHPWWTFFSTVWLWLVPIRPWIVRLAAKILPTNHD